MPGIGIGEMILIAGIALVVIGPERFPGFAKVVMRTIRDVRGYVNEAKHEIEKELNPIKKEVNTLTRYNPEQYIDKLAGAVTKADADEEKQKPAPPPPGPVHESDFDQPRPSPSGTVPAGDAASPPAAGEQSGDQPQSPPDRPVPHDEYQD